MQDLNSSADWIALTNVICFFLAGSCFYFTSCKRHLDFSCPRKMTRMDLQGHFSTNWRTSVIPDWENGRGYWPQAIIKHTQTKTCRRTWTCMQRIATHRLHICDSDIRKNRDSHFDSFETLVNLNIYLNLENGVCTSSLQCTTFFFLTALTP